jgi:glycogen debranching enzyme
LRALAELYHAVGRHDHARQLEDEAQQLQQRFDKKFWVPNMGYYAMALDAEGRPLQVLSSDPGQCLWTGIAAPEHRPAVVNKLTGPDLFSGWGIRTLGRNERAYDPFSYHRGSVWPHDTSFAIAGMALGGFDDAAWMVADGLIAAADRLPDRRLPELFAGVERPASADRPLPYPLACAPQAWAAGAPWYILQSLLGLAIDGVNKTIHVRRAPKALGRVTIQSLRVTEGTIGIVVDEDGVRATELPPGWNITTVSPDPSPRRAPQKGG